MHDPVNSPQHYASGAVECIEAIEASMSPEAFKGFLKGNIQKYVWRYEAKGGSESLHKAQWYLQRLIDLVEIEESNKEALYEAVKEMEAMEESANYDPDDYMASGCPDGFCPLPSTRQGPAEPMFPPAS
jgi:hypothetical protein